MFTRQIQAGLTDTSVTLRIIDSGDGTPETGVVFNTSGIDLWYRRELAVSTDVTEVTLAALTTAHADGGFLHINDGYYRFDLPDAAFARGVPGVQIGGTVTGMVVIGPYVELVERDLGILLLADNLASATSTALTLSAAGSSTDKLYDGCFIVPVGGTGAGQGGRYASTITTYDGTTKVLTLASSFGVTLSSDTDILIYTASAETVAVATAAALTTVDIVVDAIKVTTDKFVFSTANEVDSHVQSVNGGVIQGNGITTPFSIVP